MSDEEYQAMLQRLSAMREKSKVSCAAKKAARAAVVPPVQIEPEVLQSEPIGRPEKPEIPEVPEQPEQPLHHDELRDLGVCRNTEMPTPMPPPPRQRKAKPIAIAPLQREPTGRPKPQVMDETELDKYFAAKYKWKNAYAAPPAPPPPVHAPPPATPTLPLMAAAVRNTAQDQIRNRVNDEVMRMAMKSVFPDWN